MLDYNLAQINIVCMLAPIGSPLISEFTAVYEK